MHLQSRMMRLTGSERRWLPWFGKTGKLALGLSCFLNRKTYACVENVFEGIASTRKKLLTQWAETHWSHLGNLAQSLASDFPETSQARLIAKRRQAPFLHGPYVDRATGSIGPSTSKFHDDVTLMFYQPIHREGRVLGCLCGRVPNGVLGDLIQREAGHVYPESGDNYLFMADSRFDPMIQPGMTEVIRTIAEGEGNLRQRLDSKRFKADETGEMGRWINSFIDNLDGIVGQVIQVAAEVRKLAERTTEATRHIHDMIGKVQGEARQAVAVMENGMQGVEDDLRQSADQVQVTAGKLQGLVGQFQVSRVA